jgi:hypothetical protein
MLDELVTPDAQLYFGPESRGCGPDDFNAALRATRDAFHDAVPQWVLPT